MLEKIIATQPDHPGLSHYIIHSYDVPALADRAPHGCEAVCQIAPAAPHALHMPSHTFTRVGAWQESIDTNIASAEVAKREGSTAEELHTMDYRTYAYLQTGQRRRAADRRGAAGGERAFRSERDWFGGARGRGRVRAGGHPPRYALERGAGPTLRSSCPNRAGISTPTR